MRSSSWPTRTHAPRTASRSSTRSPRTGRPDLRAFICSRDDVVTRLECDDASNEAQPVLEGLPVRCVAAAGDRVIVGTQGCGVLLSSDGGRRWERVESPERGVVSVEDAPDDGVL